MTLFLNQKVAASFLLKQHWFMWEQSDFLAIYDKSVVYSAWGECV